MLINRKPSEKEIQAFLQGMEHAARQISKTPRGYQEAMKIRREARTLTLLNERKNYHEKTKAKIDGKRKFSVQEIQKNPMCVFRKIQGMVPERASINRC